MAGLQRIRLFCLVAIFCTGIQTSNAQDVHVFLAADHVRTFTQPYLSPSGGSLGLRFPGKRLAVEVALSRSIFGPFRYYDADRRTTGTATILYGFELNDKWRFETGAYAGYGSRYLSRRDEFHYTIVHRAFVPVGAVASVRYVRGQWVQPFLSILPTYDHLRHEIFSYYNSDPTKGVWAIMIRAGVSFALPNDPERGK